MKKQNICPTCTKQVSMGKDNKYRPFCSERCKMIDLGEWAQESYAIPDNRMKPDEMAIDDLDEFTKH